MRQQVLDTVKKCPTCQMCKRSTKKYGLLPEKYPEINPWEQLCVDLVGPYDIPIEGTKDEKATFWAITMIDPTTGWFEIIPIEEKTAVHVMNQVEIAWLTRYPWPCTLTCDQGTEFMKEFSETIREDYGINKMPAFTRNPQGNAVLERIHQTLGNMV